MELQKRKEILDSLNIKLKRKKYFAMLLALFTLGVNIFAWFVFSTSVNLQLNASVSSWDVTFNDGNDELTKNVIISVTNMRPGMEDFKKTYVINNAGEVGATFSFKITSIELLGKTIDLTKNPDAISYFNTYFPFNISFSNTKDFLNYNESLDFSFNLEWGYDSNDKYYSQTNIYEYNPTFDYYKKNSQNSYIIDNTIDSVSMFNNNKSNLFLDKDDADTYFGMKCKDYESSSGMACLKINIKLIAEQVNE